MPLTSKGEKLRDKFRGQYGKKKGDSIFYAMENSGKLKKVLKAQYGGGADAGGKKSPGQGTYKSPARAYEPPPGEKGGAGYIPPKNTVGGSNLKTIQKKISNIDLSGGMALGLAKKFIFDPLTKASRTAAAKGENLINPFAKKKMPSTRDYYRLTNKPLDVMSPEGKQFLIDDKKIKATPPTVFPDDRDGIKKCPDGTLPPCTTPTSASTKPLQVNFLKNFQAYNSGGVSSGPPPRRGPNPQVPPIKMRSGKMTKKYKMSCPNRPDGIRGMGAAIKGHKFIGVK